MVDSNMLDTIYTYNKLSAIEQIQIEKTVAEEHHKRWNDHQTLAKQAQKMKSRKRRL